MNQILDVQGLSVEFPQRRQNLQALDLISFTLNAGEVLGFVGGKRRWKISYRGSDHGIA